MIPQGNMPRRQQGNQQNDCEIEIKKTRTGSRVRFKGKCTKEMLDYAKAEAESLPEGVSKKIVD